MPFSELGKTDKKQLSHNEGGLENSLLDVLCFEWLLYIREEVSSWICGLFSREILFWSY